MRCRHYHRRVNLFRIFLPVLAALLLSAAVTAQPFPSRPLRVIVPNGAGGSTDLVARTIANKLADALGQQIIVDNRGGSGGIIGTELVAKAAADGHTLLVGTIGNLAISPHLYRKLPYDPLRDFAPITRLTAAAYMLLVNPGLPPKSLRDFVAYAKSRNGQLSYASAGNGTGSHLSTVLFLSVAGIELAHVPYKGGGPAIADLLGGQVQMTTENVFLMMPYINAGQLRPIAVTSLKRSSILPDVPTNAESGYPNFEIIGQFGFVAPVGTPDDVIVKLNSAFNKILKSPEIIKKLNAQGSDVRSGTPEAFQAILQSESTKWLGVIKDANIKGE